MVLHYKKDGTLDMRYSSSKAAVASYSSRYQPSGGMGMCYANSYASATPAWAFQGSIAPTTTSSGLHYKKDGTLDMRYSSSKQAVAMAAVSPSPCFSNSGAPLHYKKDGTLDMRFRSSREAIAVRSVPPALQHRPGLQMECGVGIFASTSVRATMGIPEHVPITRSGRPDLRTRAAKDWVVDQARSWSDVAPLPPWIPRRKDGSPDLTRAAARNFFKSAAPPPAPRRKEYYQERLMNETFSGAITETRALDIDRVEEPAPLRGTESLRRVFEELSFMELPATDKSSGAPSSAIADPLVEMPTNVVEVDYATDLTINIDKSDTVLGTGSFGVAYKGKWKDQIVAVKKLHTSQLTKKDRRMFIKEALVLGCWVLTPTSLSYLLHYCDDPIAEAKMTDGRIKLNLLMGITHGMMQLHACGVTHGDIKPQNVLVTKDFQAKIADFGLATFRAKTSSITSSHRMVSSSVKDEADDVEADPEAVVCGTAAYMAPELLESGHVADELTDVYSFGILINEVLQEEEPYYQHLRKFVGKGPYAAALAAQQGLRPVMDERKVTSELKELIERCWSRREENRRPRFDEIAEIFELCSGIPNSIV
ncbi:hypothetical protein Poli38472_008777 [Pythium oligandrum]|uniref:Protein kinase domain-containing protein n=1 Tax=Pythium oligandrum TaxID=41045 RepID=A0A8K1FCS4_PYTOL|nr:hypothetical protein Poli38472_008777 [Pythium oligandrum]|eukprot:TMW56129.1 hypothetical protein Poli38472_008777 [Pythium oligandrum]